MKFEQIDTPSGHILVCLALILVGAIFDKVSISKGDDLIIGGSSALLFAMKNAVTRGKDPEAKA